MALVRIAQVCARAFPLVGGIETHVGEVSRRLAQRGHDVTIITTDRTGLLPVEECRDGFRIRRYGARPRSRDWYASSGLALDVVRGAYDLVHVQGIHTFSAPFGMMAALTSRTPYVLTFHTGGHSSARRDALREPQWHLLAPLMRRAARLIAVCSYEIGIFSPFVGGDPATFAQIRNGADLPRPTGEPVVLPANAMPVITSVGRLERYKGHHRLIMAMPFLLQQHPSAIAVIVGGGPYLKDLRQLARSTGVAENVIFRAFEVDERGLLADLLLRSDVVVLLSEYEAHPVAVMEAIGLGRPVLVARTSGLTELADAGLVRGVSIDAPMETIARAIVTTIGQVPPPVHVQSWDDTVDALEPVYEEAIATGR